MSFPDESIEYRVCYHDPEVAERAGPQFDWVDFLGRADDSRGGRTDVWRSAFSARQAFLDDKEKRHLPFRILKIRTIVEVVEIPAPPGL